VGELENYSKCGPLLNRNGRLTLMWVYKLRNWPTARLKMLREKLYHSIKAKYTPKIKEPPDVI